MKTNPISPAEAALYGLAAGLTATLLGSLLVRIPGIRQEAERANIRFHPESGEETAPMMSPEMALVQSSSPGMEGPAGVFAAKVASGLFGRDISRRERFWGKVVNFAYGGILGITYGIIHPRRRWRPAVSGVGYGLAVWTLGPATLVPAMKLLPPPNKAPLRQNLISLIGNLIHGVAVAYIFNRLTQGGPANESSPS